MGFNIYTVKQRAWENLRINYWSAFLLFILSAVLTSIVSGVVSLVMRILGLAVPALSGAAAIFSDNNFIVSPAIIGAAIMTTVISLIINFAASILANEAIAVGMKKSYLNLNNGNMQIENLAYGFTGNYLNVFKVAALKWLYITIGTILFYIPGIIFTYRYMMTPYILAENPDIDYKRALKISRAMMKGNKFQTFLFQLSFIGWFLLGCLACGVGTVFVYPYYFMAETELYKELRNKAIENGSVNEMELSGVTIY